VIDGRAVEAPEPERVLRACLEYLPNTWDPEMGGIEVLDAWVDPPATVYVVFRREPAAGSIGVIGYRRDFPPHAERGNPESSGEALAEDIAEPLGNVTIRRDPATGISWVGIIPPAPFPVRPPRAD